ncbi:hypothetical protein [Butyrivibrio proteoclasticus]|uniref:hypothetical protein n=1 Tax=Butyrivibrio proteoclasticus TaxID=43305 RepID=UPI000A6F139C|nr:hypothetical protein [Butyrivibrio proteoclasticus]
MLKETLRTILKKEDKKPAQNGMFLGVPKKVMEAFDKATEFLEVRDLNIRIVPYIVNSPTIYAMGYANAPVKGVLAEEYCRGCYMENENTIYLARYAPLDDTENRTFNNREIIESMLHEIRHVWQKQYHADIYYAGDNAISNEAHMGDISEIDADAFALAYFLFVLGYENEDLSFDMAYCYSSDGGKRKERTREIIGEYSFVNEG